MFNFLGFIPIMGVENAILGLKIGKTHFWAITPTGYDYTGGKWFHYFGFIAKISTMSTFLLFGILGAKNWFVAPKLTKVWPPSIPGYFALFGPYTGSELKNYRHTTDLERPADSEFIKTFYFGVRLGLQTGPEIRLIFGDFWVPKAWHRISSMKSFNFDFFYIKIY